METRKTVQQLSSGKAPYADAIPSGVYEAGATHVRETDRVLSLYVEAIPQEFKDASIIHPYKRKGNPKVCDNHRAEAFFLL